MVEASPAKFEVFISHSSKDKPWADAACAVLEQRRIRCWIAPRDIIPGLEWGDAIVQGITACKIMVLIFSDHANASGQVRREVERGISGGLIILPVRIEDVRPTGAMEFALGNRHWLDAFTAPVEEQMVYLADSVTKLLRRESGTNRPTSGGSAKLPPAIPVPPGGRIPLFSLLDALTPVAEQMGHLAESVTNVLQKDGGTDRPTDVPPVKLPAAVSEPPSSRFPVTWLMTGMIVILAAALGFVIWAKMDKDPARQAAGADASKEGENTGKLKPLAPTQNSKSNMALVNPSPAEVRIDPQDEADNAEQKTTADIPTDETNSETLEESPRKKAAPAVIQVGSTVYVTANISGFDDEAGSTVFNYLPKGSKGIVEKISQNRKYCLIKFPKLISSRDVWVLRSMLELR